MTSRSLLHSAQRAAVALMFTVACSSSTEPAQDTKQPPALDALPRPLTADETSLIGATNSFSFDLFRRLSAVEKDSNVFASPLSASLALGMALNGADGTTQTEMKRMLAYGSASDQAINASYKSLMTLLRGLDTTIDVRIANSAWARAGFPVNQSFTDAAKSWFDARVSTLDFDSPTAPTTINAWVSDATAGKIPTIIDRIEKDNVLFLINAIYFKGSWRQRFDPALTQAAPFHGVRGDQTVKMMHRSAATGVLYAADYTAVDLPYGNGAFSMTVVVPAPGKTVDALAASLSGSTWQSLVGQLHTATVDLYLPRFKLEWERKLNDDLDALGMHEAFDWNAANFSKLSPVPVYISVVKQKTYVDVNEEGTEAAAVTNVGISEFSLPIPLRIDRPFVVVIRERLSGTVIFMGKIVSIP